MKERCWLVSFLWLVSLIFSCISRVKAAILIMKTEKQRPWGAVIAAVLALVMLVSVFVWRQEQNVQLLTPEEPSAFDDFYGSALYQAALEWAACLKPFEKYGVNGPSEQMAFAEPYGYYHVYNEEMKEELDRICEEYGLSLQGRGNVKDTYQELLDHLGTENVLAFPDGVEHQTFGTWYYPDGSYWFGGDVIMGYEGSLWEQPIGYEFHRTMKTCFTEELLYVVAFQNYDAWEYTTENGVPLRLAIDEEAGFAYLFAEAEDSVIFVRISDQNTADNVAFEMTMSHEAVEAFAECFDFNVPVYDGEVPPEPNMALLMVDKDLYSAPVLTGDILGQLEAGSRMEIMRLENVNNVKWVLTYDGWITAEDLDLYYDAEVGQ